MEMFFLEAKIPLSKTYIKTEEGFEKQPYPMARHVTSHKEEVTSLRGFYSALQSHAKKNHCLLKGPLTHDLEFESRAGTSNPFDRTKWLCLDFDYIDSESSIEPVLQQMGLGDVSYIMQYGAGHGIDKPFSAHLFMLLDQEVLPEQLKVWLMHQNLTLGIFERQISLARSNAALRWPLDIAVAHNHMLIYIAPPTCEGFDDPVEDRMKLVEKTRSKASIQHQIEALDAGVVEEQKNKKLSELRKKKGLPAKKFSTKLVSGIEVLSKPGSTTVTGQKQARGFMYLNLNSGDSWGYYHPIDNPEILYNFKGEPNYLTKELIPEYYKAYRKVLRDIQKEEEGDLIYLAFLDRKSDTYFRGTFEPINKLLELYPTNSSKKVTDFLKQHNQWVGEFIEEWDYLFRFDDPRILVPEEKFVNRYRETDVMREARGATPPKSFPPTIRKILMSVTGNNVDAVKRLVNWFAFIVQKRRQAQTAWVFSGCQGTGKGLLVHHIMAPILGKDVVQVKPMSALDEDYTAYMENCVLLMLDETSRDQVGRNKKARAKLYQAITDPVIPIRAMRTDHYMAKNYMNVIVASNHRDAIDIEATDRRFNVGDYQDNRLVINDSEVDKLEDEAFDFASLLYNVNIDMHKVRTPMKTKGKENMRSLTINSVEALLQGIFDGDLQLLIDLVPGEALYKDAAHGIMMDRVKTILRTAERHAYKNTPHPIQREELQMILTAMSGESIPDSPNKFTHLVKHHGVFFERLHIGNRRAMGIEINWKVPEYGTEAVFGSGQKIRSVK